VILLAHLSDTHLDGTARSTQRTARVMAYLNELPQPVDAIVITGDIADHGDTAEYQQARALLRSRYPTFTCPGNHDDRVGFRTVLLGENGGTEPSNTEPSNAGLENAGPDSAGPINQVHQAAGAVFMMCDSSVPGKPEGFLADETLRWLTGALDAAPAGSPVFVCFHHPPVRLHSPFIDPIRQRGEARLANLIAGRPQVVGVLCGHAHTPAATTFAGCPLRVAPGVASTLRLPWEHGDALDYGPPPGIAFHVLDDEWRLTTHYRLLD
jgi:Icc protein